MQSDSVYFDPEGFPIDVAEWATWQESPRRPTRLSRLNDVQLKTTYLGFVDPRTPGTALYGSAVFNTDDAGAEINIVEVDLYDTKFEAYDGHDRHRLAMVAGFHCDRCKQGREHP